MTSRNLKDYGQPGASSSSHKDLYKTWIPPQQMEGSANDRARYKSSSGEPKGTDRSSRHPEGRHRSSSRDHRPEDPSAPSSSYQYASVPSAKEHRRATRPSATHVTSSYQPATSQGPLSAQAVHASSRSHSKPSQTETYDPRIHSHKRSATTPTPQSSYERVSGPEGNLKASRAAHSSRTGQIMTATPNIQAQGAPAQDSTRRHRDRERDAETRYKESQQEVYERRDKEKRVKGDERRERDTERYKEREAPGDKDRPHKERLDSRGQDPDSSDSAQKNALLVASSHRRHRTEEGTAPTGTVRQRHNDSSLPRTKQVSNGYSLSTSAQHPSNSTYPTTKPSHSQETQEPGAPPAPRVMPVYLPEKPRKSHHDRAMTAPSNPQQSSGSDTERPSRREHRRHTTDQPSALRGVPVEGARSSPEGLQQKPRSGATQVERQRDPATSLPIEHGPKQTSRSRSNNVSGSKSAGIRPDIPLITPAFQQSYLPTENHDLGTGAPQFVSIRAGQGPSDPHTAHALSKAPYPTAASGGTRSTHIHERSQSYDAHAYSGTPSAQVRPHIRNGTFPTSSRQSTEPARTHHSSHASVQPRTAQAPSNGVDLSEPKPYDPQGALPIPPRHPPDLTRTDPPSAPTKSSKKLPFRLDFSKPSSGRPAVTSAPPPPTPMVNPCPAVLSESPSGDTPQFVTSRDNGDRTSSRSTHENGQLKPSSMGPRERLHELLSSPPSHMPQSKASRFPVDEDSGQKSRHSPSGNGSPYSRGPSMTNIPIHPSSAPPTQSLMPIPAVSISRAPSLEGRIPTSLSPKPEELTNITSTPRQQSATNSNPAYPYASQVNNNVNEWGQLYYTAPDSILTPKPSIRKPSVHDLHPQPYVASHNYSPSSSQGHAKPTESPHQSNVHNIYAQSTVRSEPPREPLLSPLAQSSHDVHPTIPNHALHGTKEVNSQKQLHQRSSSGTIQQHMFYANSNPNDSTAKPLDYGANPSANSSRPGEMQTPLYPSNLYRPPSRPTYTEVPAMTQNTYVSNARPEEIPRSESRNAYHPHPQGLANSQTNVVQTNQSNYPAMASGRTTTPKLTSHSSRNAPPIDPNSRIRGNSLTAPLLQAPYSASTQHRSTTTNDQTPSGAQFSYTAPSEHKHGSSRTHIYTASSDRPTMSNSSQHRPVYSTSTRTHAPNQIQTPLTRSISNDVDLLKTPSSLAPSTLKPVNGRAPPSPKPSYESRKKGGFLSMFRSKSSTPAYEPQLPTSTKISEHSRSQSETKLPSKPPSIAKVEVTIPKSSSRGKASAPIAVSLPVHSTGRKEASTKVFSPFRFMTSKRNRTMSAISLEAQDGTANNTVIGSPTQSTVSQATAYPPPPLRDPLIAAREWRNRETDFIVDRGTNRRHRPGVVFDLEEDRSSNKPDTSQVAYYPGR